jgi:hypothetical protein
MMLMVVLMVTAAFLASYELKERLNKGLSVVKGMAISS